MGPITPACDTLPPSSAYIAVEALIDDERRERVFGSCCGKRAGFSRFEVLPHAGP